ncbi:hypothetical protein A9264_04375 [Vibrio sp. UCD-FRSSP16_10]|uniref:hypothetical protein n=1 Tax=unclassified Vibrio TaxID=2614977 RepID=UPI0007FC0B83|nr:MULTISPECIES: hypothetical protein [unclassified Vibrio]OBT10201.1 hypothetical protein A9260_05825 [Vibrio sp. UCD-FRSSP16_30]OBT18991.1 hypothetical protein A9264_04375 [Vibrio sp. UCD-FRSSP16_10]
MKKCALFSILTSIVLLGCSSTEQSQQPQTAAIDNTTQPLPQLIPSKEAPARVLVRGQIIVGHESRTIQPCNSNATYWLKLPDAVRTMTESMKTEPHQAMYAEVFGYFEPATTGFAAEFGSQFVVTEFNIITAENPNRCEKPTQGARAFGNEPAWTASVSDSNVELNILGKEPQQLPVVNLEQSIENTRYDLTKGQLNIRPQVCRDTMSNSIYGWTADLKTATSTVTGCYSEGNLSTDDVVGQYSQSIDATTNLTLTLSSDHQAKTRYSYSDGSGDIKESGHWQTLISGLIQVTSVTYQGQPIIAIREFERKDDTLSTQHETINGATYPLTNDGLTLKKDQ